MMMMMMMRDTYPEVDGHLQVNKVTLEQSKCMHIMIPRKVYIVQYMLTV